MWCIREQMLKVLALLSVSVLLIIILTNTCEARQPIHPMNKKLMHLGLLKKPPKYYPEIPRITAELALSLYYSQKALFLYIASDNQNIIVGGFHLTEGQYPKINPNKLPFSKKQVLVVY